MKKVTVKDMISKAIIDKSQNIDYRSSSEEEIGKVNKHKHISTHVEESAMIKRDFMSAVAKEEQDIGGNGDEFKLSIRSHHGSSASSSRAHGSRPGYVPAGILQ